MLDLDRVLTEAAAGKHRTNLRVLTDEGEIAIPVLVVIGEAPGPTSMINGGTHGDEFDGPEAIRRFWHSISPAQVHGRVVLVPALNLPAYLAARRNNPLDEIDMSGAWTDDAPDSTTTRIARAVARQILPHVTARLDMHGGGDIFTIARLCMFTRSRDEHMLARQLEVAKGIGIEKIWQFPERAGAANYFEQRNILSIGVEIGGEARLREQDVSDCLLAIHNFLITIGNLVGTVVLPRHWLCIAGRPDHSSNGGFLRSFVELGDRVTEGQRLGLISDVAGDTIEEVVARQSGVVTTIRTKPILPAGGATFQVSTITEVIPNPAYEERA